MWPCIRVEHGRAAPFDPDPRVGYEPNVGPLNYSVDLLKGFTDTWPWTSPVMASESEKTPESVEVKALEDLKAEHGALRPCGDSGEPSGRPVSYGPGDGAMNPFWSETTREEALLRSMRPLELPAPGDQVVEGSLKQPYYSPPKDMDPVMMQAMFQKLVEENARLWAERQMTGFGGQHPANAPGGPGYGPCQPMSSMMALTDAGQPSSSTMGSLWEKMKTTVHHPPGGDLLRGLTPPPSPAPVQGGLSHVVQEVKTNLLGVFNSASTEVKNEPAAMSGQQHPGGEQGHGTGHQAGGHGGWAWTRST